MPDIVIRPYEPADAGALSQLRWDSVRGIGARAYSAEQIQSWLPAPEPIAKVRGHFEDGRQAWIAAGPAGSLCGAVDLEADGHIDYLYVSPSAAGRGIGRALVEHAVAQARSQNVSRLYTEASELARPVFVRCGFAVTHRRDFDLRGVSIHNYAMERDLASKRG